MAIPPGAALYVQQRESGITLLSPSGAQGNTDDGDGLSSTGWSVRSHASSTAQCVWPCSRTLATALLDAPRIADCHGLTVLELGAGCGVPGLAAWRAGATAVWLTELPENVARLHEITQRHGSPASVRVEALDWTQPLPQAIAQTRFDLVLGADLIFWPSLFDALLSVLEALRDAPRVLLATSSSNWLAQGSDFELRAVSRGWKLWEHPVAATDASFDVYDFSPRLLEMARVPNESGLRPPPVSSLRF